MAKYTTQSDAGAARARSLTKPERSVRETDQPTYQSAMRVDPSVRLGPLQGEQRGSVPMSVTIGKPQAYQPKKGTP